MEIKIKVKPQKRVVTNVAAVNMYAPTASTKAALLRSVLTGFGSTWGEFGYGYTRFNDENTVRVVNLEKRRRVVKLVTDKKLLKKGIKRQVVTPAHWVAYVYDFGIDVLHAAGLKVDQGARTFKLKNFK